MSVAAHRRQVLLRESAVNVGVAAAGGLLLGLARGRRAVPRRGLKLLGGFVTLTAVRAMGITVSDYLWKRGQPPSAQPPR